MSDVIWEDPFCGMNDETGEKTPAAPGTVGHCGVRQSEAPLLVEDGIWVCQSDSSWMEDR